MDIQFTGKYEWALIDENDNVVDSGEEYNVVTDDFKYIFYANVEYMRYAYNMFGSNYNRIQLYNHPTPIQSGLDKDIRTYHTLLDNVTVSAESPKSTLPRAEHDTQFYYIYNFDKPASDITHTAIGLKTDYNSSEQWILSYLEFTNPITQHTNERLYIKYVLNATPVGGSGSTLLDNVYSNINSVVPLWYADGLRYKDYYSNLSGVFSYLTYYLPPNNIDLVGSTPYTSTEITSSTNHSNSSIFGRTYSKTLDNNYTGPIGTTVSVSRPGVSDIYGSDTSNLYDTNTSKYNAKYKYLTFKYSPSKIEPTISRSFKHTSDRLFERWSDVDYPPQSKGSFTFAGTPNNKIASTQHIEFVKSGMASDTESEQAEYFLYENTFYDTNKHIVSIDVDTVTGIDDFNRDNSYSKIKSKEMHLDNWTYTIQEKYGNLWLCVWNKGTIEMSEGLEDIGISSSSFTDIIYVDDNHILLFTLDGNKQIEFYDDKTWNISDYADITDSILFITEDPVTKDMYLVSNTILGQVYQLHPDYTIDTIQLDGGMNDVRKTIRRGQISVYDNILCRGGHSDGWDGNYTHPQKDNTDYHYIWFYDIINDTYHFPDWYLTSDIHYVYYYEGFLYLLDGYTCAYQHYMYLRKREYTFNGDLGVDLNVLMGGSDCSYYHTSWSFKNYTPFVPNKYDTNMGVYIHNVGRYTLNGQPRYACWIQDASTNDSWTVIDQSEYNDKYFSHQRLKYGWDDTNSQWVKELDTPRKMTTGTHELLNGINVVFNNATGVVWDTNFIKDESVAVTTALMPISDNLQTHTYKYRYLHCRYDEIEGQLTMGTVVDGDGFVNVRVPEATTSGFRDMDSNQDAANSGIGMSVVNTSTTVEYTFRAKDDTNFDDESYYADTLGYIYMSSANSGIQFDTKYIVTYF